MKLFIAAPFVTCKNNFGFCGLELFSNNFSITKGNDLWNENEYLDFGQSKQLVTGLGGRTNGSLLISGFISKLVGWIFSIPNGFEVIL